MKELKQLITPKARYEEPKIDVILFSCANVLTASEVEDQNTGEWDPLT